MFKKILLATDGSTHSFRAAEKAIEIATYNKDSLLEIIYVVDVETLETNGLRYAESIQIEEKKGKEKMLFIEKKAQKFKVNYEVNILHGEPGYMISKYCNENHFDMVVIGNRGLNTMQKMVLGSVSQTVAKKANCPVMIVK